MPKAKSKKIKDEDGGDGGGAAYSPAYHVRRPGQVVQNVCHPPALTGNNYTHRLNRTDLTGRDFKKGEVTANLPSCDSFWFNGKLSQKITRMDFQVDGETHVRAIRENYHSSQWRCIVLCDCS